MVNDNYVKSITFLTEGQWFIIYTKDFDISNEELHLNIYKQFYEEWGYQ